MDENSIQVLHEDLTEEFRALASTHTTTIGKLLEEFNDDQLLSMLDTENASRLSEGPEDVVTEEAQGSPAQEHESTKQQKHHPHHPCRHAEWNRNRSVGTPTTDRGDD